ncbi:hypothetical protein CN271_18120 [Bacillus cereus]|nr:MULTISPECIES: hypothetical protein [Bacillus cereus group]PEE38004.1 hypothetical protein CON59_06360 [Bacillus cereus]PEK78132.1 hypothetical protein CN594_26535 [Bacillus toyonensis]PEO63296.1 hypothetical protein CN579_14510 [Bacillus toyonensis]PET41669.1 hypothetical protein CN523_23075 [Bacillus cereus]PEV83491.1 hypothetical protein CN429_11675 [Bacillus cereus]
MDTTNDVTAREAKKAYMRAWRAANKEKVKATQERYWKKVAQKMNTEESEIKNDYNRNWYQKNKSKRNDYMREYYQKKKQNFQSNWK